MLRRTFLLTGLSIFHRKPVETLGGVEFKVVRNNAKSPRRYIFIHGNEDTAREVMDLHMQAYEGTAFSVTGKDRYVTVAGLKVDPNRMFSRVGAEKSLRDLNPNVDPGPALELLEREREKLMKRITPGPGSRLVALHNNREYSVKSEIEASDETSIKEPGRPRNFFLCTDPKDYAILKQSPFNVVLQAKPDPDDGSLSRLAAKRGFRYINLECGLGELEAQLERLRWLENNLP